MSAPGRPLNLLVVTNDLLVGGVQRNVVRYFRHFDRERFRLHLVTVCEAGPLTEEVRATGARVDHIRAIGSVGSIKTITPWGVLRLAKRMREWRIDVAQTRLFLGNTIGRAAAICARVPVIVAAEHSTYYGKTPLQIAIDRRLARRTDRIAVVSSVVKDFTAVQERLPPQSFQVIHNGLDLERFLGAAGGDAVRREFGIPADAFVIGSVSRLIPEKGFAPLVRLLPRIRARAPEVVLFLVGDGEEREAIEQAVREAGVGDIVRLAGQRDDIPECLRAMDLFVLPSRREGLPTAVLEAMAAGVPVLTHNLPQFREIVTAEKDGRIVDFTDEDAAVEAVVRLAADAGLRRSLAEAGRARARDFSIERMVEGYASLYLELWDRKRGSKR